MSHKVPQVDPAVIEWLELPQVPIKQTSYLRDVVIIFKRLCN